MSDISEESLIDYGYSDSEQEESDVGEEKQEEEDLSSLTAQELLLRKRELVTEAKQRIAHSVKYITANPQENVSHHAFQLPFSSHNPCPPLRSFTSITFTDWRVALPMGSTPSSQELCSG